MPGETILDLGPGDAIALDDGDTSSSRSEKGEIALFVMAPWSPVVITVADELGLGRLFVAPVAENITGSGRLIATARPRRAAEPAPRRR